MKVLVVGASSGLGAAIGLHHGARGDDVIAIARRVDRLRQISAVQQSPGDWVNLRADVTHSEGFARTVAAAHSVDRIYLCAASNADAEQQTRLNFLAPARIAATADRRGLTVILISSLAAVVAFPELATYCATKAALEHWVAVHRETADATVLVVRPGRFNSEFHTGPRPLDIAGLPHGVADQVITAVDRGRGPVITLGGARDRAAAAAARIVGPNLARALL